MMFFTPSASATTSEALRRHSLPSPRSGCIKRRAATLSSRFARKFRTSSSSEPVTLIPTATVGPSPSRISPSGELLSFVKMRRKSELACASVRHNWPCWSTSMVYRATSENVKPKANQGDRRAKPRALTRRQDVSLLIWVSSACNSGNRLLFHAEESWS